MKIEEIIFVSVIILYVILLPYVKGFYTAYKDSKENEIIIKHKD